MLLKIKSGYRLEISSVIDPLKKLDYKMLESFLIIGNKEISIELQLLQSIEIHNIFYLNLLRKASIKPLTN